MTTSKWHLVCCKTNKKSKFLFAFKKDGMYINTNEQYKVLKKETFKTYI